MLAVLLLLVVVVSLLLLMMVSIPTAVKVVVVVVMVVVVVGLAKALVGGVLRVHLRTSLHVTRCSVSCVRKAWSID